MFDSIVKPANASEHIAVLTNGNSDKQSRLVGDSSHHLLPASNITFDVHQTNHSSPLLSSLSSFSFLSTAIAEAVSSTTGEVTGLSSTTLFVFWARFVFHLCALAKNLENADCSRWSSGKTHVLSKNIR
jgi:hypothetical protein